MAYESIDEIIDEVREMQEVLKSDPTDQEALDFLESVGSFVEDFGRDSEDLLSELDAIEGEVIYIVPEYNFSDHVKEVANEVYGLDNLPYFITSNIDWDGVAEDFIVDYTEYTINGETYLVR